MTPSQCPVDTTHRGGALLVETGAEGPRPERSRVRARSKSLRFTAVVVD